MKRLGGMRLHEKVGVGVRRGGGQKECAGS